ncbi:hypothetical protein O181_087633 [Austropuccinia psidii MF-1]|uniref:Tf2-1-like SH3-like domain-containing protein n=1 Tax=Austropuccinia psidii MF-1 TaxID=1389203 RepID=A0A9Q3IQ06_9BASI|nr:hypothetical protein [Austropuccinia psidii MF-1]
MVWLSSKNIKSTRHTKKLSEKWLVPFPILKKVSTHAYHLKLPSQWKSIHPVFHISLLEPVKTSTIPNWHQEPPPPFIIEEKEECQMSKEDQAILMSYVNLLPAMKFFSKFNTSGFLMSNPSQQHQKASTLVWCSGAHHAR